LYEIVEIVQHVFVKIFAAREKFFCLARRFASQFDISRALKIDFARSRAISVE
jgi:hypothetical protein